MTKGKDWIQILVNVFIVGLYLLAIIRPFYDAYVVGNIDFERQIDPEYLNGLLTASSILFGFSSLLVVGQKPMKKLYWVFLLPPLFLIMFAAGGMSDVALGKASSVEAMLILTSCFWANLASTSFLAGYMVSRTLGGETSKQSEN